MMKLFTSSSDLCLISLVSSQQADISKWKNRAIKLKVKSKAEGDKMASPSTPTKTPSTPTKRGFSTIADSHTVLHAPKKFLLPANKLLDSPKSRFFDTGEGSELLSRSRPKQFFDNSALGNIPGKPHAKSKVQIIYF